MRTTLLLPIAFLPLAAFCQDGVLDPTFSSDGIATHGFGIANDVGRKVIQQPDGRILVAGNSFATGVSSFGVARLLEDGELDLSFNSEGYALVSVSEQGDAAFDMALQDDGKIVLAGVSSAVASNGIGLMRFDADGVLDMGFGTDGISITNIPGQNVEIYGVALQADGKIVVCGMAFNGNGEMLVARFDTNGAMDMSFNSVGYSMVPIGEYAVALDVAVRPDGRITVAGYTETASDASLAAARLTTTGTLDSSFGTNGVVTTELGYSWERINGFTLDPDGALIGAGTVGTGFDFSTFDAIAVRYLMDGTLDTSFGSDGWLQMDHSGAADGGYDAMLQSDGKILICGSADVAGRDQFALTRLLPSGVPDNTFGTGGTVVSTVGAEGGVATSIATQSDGKVLIAGTYDTGIGGDFAVARYTNGPADGIAVEATVRTIAVFPNPTTDRIRISSPDIARSVMLEMMDMEGRVVLQRRVGSARLLDVDVRDLAAGRYAVRLIADDALYVGAFVKYPER